MAVSAQYPRPDYERKALRWESLNGHWDFLFDDDDVGLSKRWHHSGLPDEIEVTGAATGEQGSSEADTVTQRLFSGAQELFKDNVLSKSSKTVHSKRQILVPYVFQSPASGINDRGVHEVLWYERTISDGRTPEEKQQNHRILLRFGAVDYEATVWVNGQLVGSHRGGHVPFELDVTDAVEAGPSSAHRLTLRIFDSAYDLAQPRGKQYWGAKPESIFYTPSGGIWQNVWLEVVPPVRIADSSHGTVIKSNDIKSGKLHGTIAVTGRGAGHNYSVQIEASFAGQSAGVGTEKLPRDTDAAILSVNMKLDAKKLGELPQSTLQQAPLEDDSCWRDGVALWSPEHPQLYDLSIQLLDGSGKVVDEVLTTTGMRSIDWTRGDGTWRLNDKPYFQVLCLDQGYWPETFMTPPSPESLKADIELAKKMGFNGCRKHQKVEDPLFYYYADRIGYLVWAEMASGYAFSQDLVERFNQEWTESVKLAINRPSVVTWTTANESWGYTSLKDNVDQRNHLRALYYITKNLDDSRSINDNCGWEHVITDLTTFHDYRDGEEFERICSSLEGVLEVKAGRDTFVRKIEGRDAGATHQAGAPIMCTEFGGVNIAPANKDQAKSSDKSADWGYTTASNSEDLLKRVERLIKAVTNGGQCCALVYTQLTDVEQETNGLYTFDRKEKLDSARVKALIEEAVKSYYDSVKSRTTA